MKKLYIANKNMRTIILLLLLLPLQLLSQNGHIELTKIATGRIILIDEGRRVRVTDVSGRSHFGRIKILDGETILLRKDTIALSQVASIQKRQLSKAILTGVLIFFGEASVTTSLVLLLAGYPTAGAVTFFLGIAMIPYGIVLSPLGNRHDKKRWTFKIVSP